MPSPNIGTCDTYDPWESSDSVEELVETDEDGVFSEDDSAPESDNSDHETEGDSTSEELLEEHSKGELTDAESSISTVRPTLLEDKCKVDEDLELVADL